MNDKNSILIVDDEKLQLRALTLILGKNYTVYVAKNGEEAIEVAQKHKPDLILLDIIMPGIDGYETITRLKSDTMTYNIPVIFVTGMGGDEDQVRGFELGAADYIPRPFNQQIVLLKVSYQMKMINQMRLIERLSRIDQLTNIPNRRYFVERMEVEWGVSVRNSRPISVFILDIDHFKLYNDTYGHQQGDHALTLTAKIITDSLLRPNDFAARYGGEEFIVLLPDTDKAGAIEVGERIRSNIAAADYPITTHEQTGKLTKITVSGGVNTLIPTADDSLDLFISRADDALYLSKRSGRNKVSAYAD